MSDVKIVCLTLLCLCVYLDGKVLFVFLWYVCFIYVFMFLKPFDNKEHNTELEIG